MGQRSRYGGGTPLRQEQLRDGEPDESASSRARHHGRERRSDADERKRSDKEREGPNSRDRRYRSRSPDDGRRRRRDATRHMDRSRSREGRRDWRASRSHSSDPRKRHLRHDDHRYSEKDDARQSSRKLLKGGGPLPSQEESFIVSKGEEPEKAKEKPNYGNSGVLAAASNSVTQADGSAISLKYHEPADARKASPRDQWKLFVFKGNELLDTIDLSPRSCWLIGREMAVVDLPAEHPSISKQHAVIQFRRREKRNEFGESTSKVNPYLIDLESANGTTLNDEPVPDRRYMELRDKDIIRFGHSSREYVVMLAPKD